MPELPAGTVTFLFTDIEGSTRLWEQHPEAMPRALAAHERVLREAITRHGGHVFKTVGDGIYAVFASAAGAVAAARAAQQELLATPWDLPGGLRVRMAVHTGTAEQQDGDYLGPALNRLARLLSAGWGGQILISDATRVLVEHDLPAGATLRDHGLHRLKDLAQPERIHQLIAPELPDAFPPLRTLDVLPNNLPRQLTTFVGRDREMAEITELLRTTALLTLTGPGGSGKTRLALQAGAELIERFRDGVWLVELAAVSDPAMVPQALATALGVREQRLRPLMDAVTEFIAHKSLLLILDNCEHLLAAGAQTAATLLQASSHLRILATSQERLGVAGERVYPVPPLSVPDPRRLPPAEQLTQYEAVRLFVDRAALIQPQFALTPANAAPVARVVQKLDGIPLAIELAAARVKAMSVEQIAQRLDDRFRLLTAGSRTGPSRHQTLRAVLDWSYELLDEPERALLRRLAVFAGGFSLEAAEAVCADQAAGHDVVDLLARLVERSFVTFTEQGGQPRYRLLETVRLYGLELLKAAGEEAAVRSRHRDWYLLLAEQAELALTGRHQAAWLDRVELEHDNFRAALEWSKSDPDSAEAGLRLAGALWRFWEIRGYWTEGRDWLDAVLSRTAGADLPARAKAIGGAAYLAFFQGDYQRARALGEESLELSRRRGDKRSAVSCLNILGFEACRVENFRRAQELGEESLRLSRELGDTFGVAGSLAVMGLVARGQGDTARAQDLLGQSLQQFREIGDELSSSVVLLNLGLVVMDQGDFQRARTVFEETLTLFRALGDKWGVAFALSNLGIVSWRQAAFDRAAAFFADSLRLRQELRDRRGIATSLIGLAAVAAAQGQHERAAVLFGAAEAQRRSLDVPQPPFIRGEYETRVQAVRDALAAPAFQSAWAKGEAMDLDAAIAYALALTPPAAGP